MEGLEFCISNTGSYENIPFVPTQIFCMRQRHILWTVYFLGLSNLVFSLNNEQRNQGRYRYVEAYTVSWIRRINNIEMTILPKAIYTFNTILIKIPMEYFTELKQILQKLICNEKRSRIASGTVSKKNKDGGITQLPISNSHVDQ